GGGAKGRVITSVFTARVLDWIAGWAGRLRPHRLGPAGASRTAASLAARALSLLSEQASVITSIGPPPNERLHRSRRTHGLGLRPAPLRRPGEPGRWAAWAARSFGSHEQTGRDATAMARCVGGSGERCGC